nr:hypothetical protein BaRGS_007563 [Batillaria attramentaria]
MNFVSPQSDFIGTTLDGFSHNVTSLSPDIALNVTSIPGDVLDNVTDVSSGKDPLSEDDAPYTEYIEYRVARWILLIYRPFCAVFGVTGNILCIVVVMKTSLRHSPAAIYMVTLAALDWVVSLFAGLTLFPKDFLLGEEDFFSKSWHCRAYYFTLLFVVHFDTLTLVSMTAQRFVAVSFPLHAARWSTKRGTVVTLAFAAGLAFLANVVHLVTFRLQSFDGSYRGRCSVGSGLGEYVQMRVYPWIDSALYFFFPTVTISILNVLIYRAVKKADRFKRTAHTDTESRRGNDRDEKGPGHNSLHE